MSVPAPGPALAAGHDDAVRTDRRLHPMSWLFVLIQQLRQFIVPLGALLLFGRGDRNELWPLIGVGVLVASSLWRYFTYRYGIGEDSLALRSGLLNRSLRVIPFVRIQNVALRQSLLHRVFGVAEVRLESAGSKESEAQMRVLRLDQALALEALVRRRGAVSGEAAQEAATPLLRLPMAEVLRLGLVSNGGLVLVGAAVAGVLQMVPDVDKRVPRGLLRQAAQWLSGKAESFQLDAAGYLVLAAISIVLVAAALKGLSVALAVLRYHGFELSEQGRRLTAERGLLARWRTTVPRRRIQSWTLEERWMHRRLGRRRLAVDTIGADEKEEGRSLKELAPIASVAACDALIGHLLPQARWDRLDWRALPRATWWRLCLPELHWPLVAASALYWQVGAWSALALLWWPWSAFMAMRRARRMAYAVDGELVAVREGWWHRHWRFAERDKLQALGLTRSPLDRCCGTATLWLDTAGAGALGPPLRIRFLPEAEARRICDALAAQLSRQPLRW